MVANLTYEQGAQLKLLRLCASPKKYLKSGTGVAKGLTPQGTPVPKIMMELGALGYITDDGDRIYISEIKK